MTTKILNNAIISKKPAVISEHGAPRYVVLDWDTYRKWEDAIDDAEATKRLFEALNDRNNQKRVKISNLKV